MNIFFHNNNFNKKLNRNVELHKGYTLLEIILYVSFTAVVLLAAGAFSLQILFNKARQVSISEVTYNANFAMEHMTTEIKTANSIDEPLEGGVSTSLTLRTASTSTDPTVFYLEDGVLKERVGTATPVLFSTSDVIVSDLQFQNVSYSGAPSAIRIQLEIAHVNPDARPEREFTQTFYTTSVVRHSK